MTSNWILGARPRTLPAAMAPVLVGSALAFWEDSFSPLIAILALVVALALQVGVNYANDYSDGIRGTDNSRIGPVRLVGQGLASAKSVKNAALLSFLVAAVAGLTMTLITQIWWFIPIGALAVISAWYYTGGKNPYGYAGFGEVFVFVWFGLVAVIATTYAQAQHISIATIAYAVGAGALACALLVVNNLRDIPSDEKVGKKTLAVRLGDAKTRFLYVALIWVGFATNLLIAFLALNNDSLPLWSGAGAVAALAAHVPGRAVLNKAQGKDLIAVLVGTGKVQMIWATVTSIAIVTQKLFA
jgi:1,4-dihydroxy-2-naphthoate octaprenyltransferase